MILENIDGRKLSFRDKDGKGFDAYARKGVDTSIYLPLLHAEVEVVTEVEKGFEMLKDIKPVLPKTEVEKTGPVDMPPSQNIPKLEFGSGFTSVGHNEKATVPQVYKGDPKQKIITASWAMGAVLNSHALANANDALALNTTQTMERAKKLAEELIKWAEGQSMK